MNIDGTSFTFFNFTLNIHYGNICKTLVSIRNEGLTEDEEPTIETTNVTLEFPFNNQEISSKHFDTYSQFIRYGTEDGELLTHAHLIGGPFPYAVHRIPLRNKK